MSVRLVREAAVRAVDLAEAAAALGTFGVGGVLLGAHFEPLRECGNRVVKDGQTADPTAQKQAVLVELVGTAQAKMPDGKEATLVRKVNPKFRASSTPSSRSSKGDSRSSSSSRSSAPGEVRGFSEQIASTPP